MKNSLWILIKNKIKSSFKIKKINLAKFVLFAVFGLYCLGMLILSFGFILNQIYVTFKSINLENYFFAFAFAYESVILFVFSIFMTKSWLFDNKDNDLLLSLPLKKTTIFASRLISIILYNFLISIVFMVPIFYIFINHYTISFFGILVLVLALLLVPIIPTIFASLFGYIVAKITSKSRFKSLFEVIINFLFIAIYLFLFYGSNLIVKNITNNPILFNNIIKYAFFPIFLIYKAINLNSYLYLLFFVLINVILFLIFIFVLSRKYFSILSNLNCHVAAGNYKMGKMVNNGSLKSLILKELKRYFGSPMYVFNTAFGMIGLLIIAVFCFFVSKEKILMFMNMNINITTAALIFMLLLFVISMTNTTCISISLEGSSLWVLKSTPVSVKNIFFSKIFVNILVVVPLAFISLILFLFNGFINIYEFVLFILFAISINLFVSVSGLIVNLLFPNFNFSNEIEVIKRSLSCFIGIMPSLIITMVIIFLMFYFNLDVYILIYYIIGASLVLTSILIFILNTWGVKKFEKIS